jgi:hypothetical protein
VWAVCVGCVRVWAVCVWGLCACVSYVRLWAVCVGMCFVCVWCVVGVWALRGLKRAEHSCAGCAVCMPPTSRLLSLPVVPFLHHALHVHYPTGPGAPRFVFKGAGAHGGTGSAGPAHPLHRDPGEGKGVAHQAHVPSEDILPGASDAVAAAGAGASASASAAAGSAVPEASAPTAEGEPVVAVPLPAADLGAWRGCPFRKAVLLVAITYD